MSKKMLVKVEFSFNNSMCWSLLAILRKSWRVWNLETGDYLSTIHVEMTTIPFREFDSGIGNDHKNDIENYHLMTKFI